MGAGASSEENREVLKQSIYGAAAQQLQLLEKSEEEYDHEDYEDCFPSVRFSRFMRGKLPKEEIHQAISSWAQMKREDEQDDRSLWMDVMGSLKGGSLKSKTYYLQALEVVYEVLGKDDPELILTVGLQASQTAEFALAVLESFPGVQIQNVTHLERLLDFYPSWAECYEQSWAVELWTYQEALGKKLQEKDEYGRCQVLYDYFDMGATNSMAEWLRLGADPKGLLEADELEEFARLNNQVSDYWTRWPAHLELVKAIGTGDKALLSSWLDKANLTEDIVDRDSKTVGLLVLAMQKFWDSTWTKCLLAQQHLRPEYKPVYLPYEGLEIFKMLLACPELDPNVGAYSYGWHGSHVRATPLGMALMEDLDTGGCNHLLEGDMRLVAPRREIVELLANDPRVDLEDVFFEAIEDGGDEWFSALTHMECKSWGPIDMVSAMVLMKAGALMSKGWVQILEDLDQGRAEDLNEQLQQQLQEEEQGSRRQLEKNSVGCYTVVEPHSHVSCMKKSEVLKSRIDGQKEVKEWYAIVKKGSMVFQSPKSFPPNFCRVAHAIDSAWRKELGRGAVGCILDFLPFFEFNRRRVPRARFHKQVNMFGRPQALCVFEMDAFHKKIRRKLEAAEEGAEAEEAEPLEEAQPNETCWVQDSSVRTERKDDEE